MNKQQTNNQTKGSDAPQASENENPLPEAVPIASAEGSVQESPIKEEPAEEGTSAAGMEVDGDGGDGAEKDKKAIVKARSKTSTCGSQRKRFKWFIAQGYTYEEASELAVDALKYREMRAAVEGPSVEVAERDVKLAQQRKELSRFAKRKYTQLRDHGYSEEEAIALAPTLVEDPGSKPKHLKSGEPKKPGDVLRIIIAVADFPRTLFTEDQANQVKDAILKQVVDRKGTNKKPNFDGCIFFKGYLVFDCLDQQTTTWLQHRAQELQLWEGCDLRAISEKSFKSIDMFTINLPDSEQDTTEEISNFLTKQNDGVDTSKWFFAQRKLDETTKTVELMVKVDPVSAKTLQELDYKLTYKFSQVTMKRITGDLFEGVESKPKKPTPPSNREDSAPKRRRPPYRGGYRNRPGWRGGGGGNNYNGSYGQFNQGGGGGGGDYIDNLLNQLNQSLYSAGPSNAPPYRRGSGRGRWWL